MLMLMLKLKLTNFKIFEYREFIFSNKFTLISGPSGSGKTSIFMAMQFAMTGEGKKITSYGKKSCSVDFTIVSDQCQLNIVRTKGPCRLIVNLKKNDNLTAYEDKEAQAIINEFYPQWELGHLAQRLYKSFILMTPADKLTFIEKMAFGPDDIEALHKKCKALISERRERLATTCTEKCATENILKGLNVINVANEKPPSFNCADIEREFFTTKRLIEKIAAFRDRRDVINEKLNELNEYRQFDRDELINRTAKWQNHSRALADFKNFKNSNPDVPSGLSQDELKETLADFEKINSQRDTRNQLDSLKTNLEKLQEFKRQHAIKLSCPLCFGSVGLWGNLLVKDDGLKSIDYSKAQECEREISQVFFKIQQLENVLTDISDLENKYPSDVNYRQQIVMIKKQIPLELNFQRLENEMKRTECQQPHSDTNKILEAKSLIKMLDSELANLTNEKCLDNDIDELKLHLAELENRMLLVKNFETSTKAQKYWDIVQSLTLVENQLNKDVPRAAKLASLLKTCEKLALQETIEMINLLAQIYLDKLLDDITVKIQYEGRLEVVVVQNDYETDLLSLSGGELTRVIMAFTMAIVEMNNVPILMIDESLSSLDLSTADFVMSTIKENYSGIVLSISHQTTKGWFDQVVELF